jgi:thiol peroxidase
MATERKGAVTFKGTPMTLVGPQLKAGDRAPDFSVIDSALQAVNLSSSKGKVRLFSVVPSLDTPVCSQQTKRFGDELKKLPPNVQVYTVSADLPFAQKRWCGAEGVEMTTLSDHRELTFGTNYGVLVKELKLLTRAIFVVDASDKISYVEIVPEITSHPNYDKAIEAVKKAAG